MQNEVKLVTPTDALKSAFKTVYGWLKAIAIIILIVMGLYTASYIFNLDLAVMKPTLSGKVTSNGVSIVGATVKLGALETTTDGDGNFVFTDLQPASYDFIVSADGYESATTKVEVSKAFLNYSNQVNLEVKKAGVASATGKVIVQNSPEYIFLDEFIVVNGKSYQVDSVGNFTLDNISSGQVIVELESEKLINTKLSFNLSSGQTLQMPEIITSPAGDVKATLLNYVTNQPITVAQVDIQNVPNTQIFLNSNGELQIKDLVVGENYLLRLAAKDFLTREYTFTVKQGINPIPSLRMVPTTNMAIVRKDENNINQVFKIDLDGLNASPATNISRNSNTDITNVFVKQNAIYFLSNQDRVRSTLTGQAFLAYKYENQATTKLTTNTNDLGIISPNFNCNSLVNYTITKATGQNVVTKTLQTMDLAGNNRLEINKITNGDMENVKFSANCNSIFYNIANSETNNGIYEYNVNKKQNSKLLSLNATMLSSSSSGSIIAYSTVNSANNLTELYVYNIAAKQSTLIKPNILGTESYQFLLGSNDSLLYLSNSPSDSNIYSYSINGNSTVKLTNFTGSEQLIKYYQFNSLIFYETNRGLYVMDFNNPVPAVLVTSDFISYTAQ